MPPSETSFSCCHKQQHKSLSTSPETVATQNFGHRRSCCQSRAMLAQGVTRSHSVRVHAFEGAAAGRQLRPGSSSTSSSRAQRRGSSSSRTKLQEFVNLWAPLMEAEHANIKRAADRLSSIEQVRQRSPSGGWGRHSSSSSRRDSNNAITACSCHFQANHKL